MKTRRTTLSVCVAIAFVLAFGTVGAAHAEDAPPMPARRADTVRVQTADPWDPADDFTTGAMDLTNRMPRYGTELLWGVTPYSQTHNIDYVNLSTAVADVDWYKFRITPDEYDLSNTTYMIDAFSQDPYLFLVVEVFEAAEGTPISYFTPVAIGPDQIDTHAVTGSQSSQWSAWKGRVVIQPRELIGSPSIAVNHVFWIRVRPWINTTSHTYDRGNAGPYTLRIKAGPVTRLSGTNRYSGAIAMSAERWSTWSTRSQDTTVVLANGLLFADALSGAGLAGAGYDDASQPGGPMLLTAQGGLTGGVANEIERTGASGVYVLGGAASVSTQVITDLGTQIPGIRVKRLGGANRYEVAANIAREMKGLQGGVLNKRFAFIANGLDFPDALASTPMAFYNDVPILLTPPAAMPAASRQALTDCAITDVVIVGGTASVSSAVEDYLKGRLGSTHVYRIAGPNRYAVARDIARWATDQIGPGSHSDNDAGTYGNTAMLDALAYPCIGVASGENFSDALAAGPMLGRSRAPLLLTPKAYFSPYIKAPDDPSIPSGGQYFDYTRGPIERSYLFGGPGSVSDLTFLMFDLDSGW